MHRKKAYLLILMALLAAAAQQAGKLTDLIFSHKFHLEEVEAECKVCHGTADSSLILKKNLIPDMQTCFGCHDSAETKCDLCHKNVKKMRPRSHQLDWKQAHGRASHYNESGCAVCHADRSCLECHKKENINRNAHPLNYINNHTLAARGNKETCLACHQELAECMDCHRQRMVMPRTHASVGWSNRTTGGAHSRAAQFDLDMCISCHSDAAAQPVCGQCHTR
jgi:hypothetical protein